MRRHCLLSLLPLALLQAQFPKPAPVDTAGYGARIQRTMGLLATSTPVQRNRVKILFYGQSITKQDWWRQVAADLRQRYPFADLTIANLALGGFAAPMLKRVLPHDLLPFYPDLVILHDYGAEADYEEIIRWMRANTTAELALQTDHITWLPKAGGDNDPALVKSYNWHDKHGDEWLPAMARKYDLEVIDIRNPWRQYLAARDLQPAALLSDGVHLNAHGQFLMAELTKRYLRYEPRFTAPVHATDHKPQWSAKVLTLEFEGNRVDLLASRSARQPYTRARVLIDGKPPSEIPSLTVFTRPSDSLAVDWPFVIRIDHNTPLIAEDWYLTITATDSVNRQVRFEVHGSRTGPDGSGISTERFVSKSGRVVIHPEDWHLNRAAEYSKVTTPVGAVCRWKAIPLYADIYEPPGIDDRTREYPVTVAQGLSNGKHQLELIAESPEPPLLEAIRVYRPPLLP